MLDTCASSTRLPPRSAGSASASTSAAAEAPAPSAADEYRDAMAALVSRVGSAAGDAAAAPARKGGARPRKTRGGLGVKPRRVLGVCAPEDAPMVWYAAAAVDAWAKPALYRCERKALVRAGVDKWSSGVLALARGMEALVDGSAASADGTPRLRLSSPVAGWVSARFLAKVCTAAIAQSVAIDGPARSRTLWRSSAARRADAADDRADADDASRDDFLGDLAVARSTMGGASVPVFSLAGAPLAARLGRAPPPPRAAGAAEPIPGVPGAFFVADVLDAGTCAALAALGGALGAYAAAADDEAYYGAGTHSRIFLDADGAVRARLAPVLARCPPRGDASWPAGPGPAPGDLLGLNAKCRFLRYADGSSVMPHVDPAWPASDPARGVNAVVPGAESWCSVITYLDDGFRGGETTFFVDAPGGAGGCDAVAVEPTRGGCLVFFHGRHRLSPRHEGSPVHGGAKHVLRTDVLYAAAGT